LEWKTSGSHVRPQDRDVLRFEHKNGMLRNILGAQVPEMAAKHVDQVLSELLARAGVTRSEVKRWILHPEDETCCPRCGLGWDSAKKTFDGALRFYPNLAISAAHRLFCAAIGVIRIRAEWLLVDVGVWGRVQRPWGVAAGGVVAKEKNE
jgi:hypothetical protein